mgnify:CR=1 FL=1
MFNEREFLMKIFRDMVGNELDYKVRQGSLNWYEKGVLTKEDLEEIDTLIDIKNTPPESETIPDEETEETEV